MKKVLYLGTDPSHFQTDGEVIHHPAISIIPKNIQAHLADLPEYTHILFTSKNAVAVFCNLVEPHTLQTKNLIAIGKVTAEALESRGLSSSLIAKEETQEGLIQELALLDWEEAYLFFPRSSLSRSPLLQFFIQRGVRVQVCDLYETKLLRLPPLDLSTFHEIVFTSPSTVEAFFHNFSTVPRGVRLTALGPITKSALGKIAFSLYDGS